MRTIFPHAAPAELDMASLAVHMWTSTIFLNAYFAFWTLAHILPEKESPQTNDVSGTTNIISMPGSLTSKTCVGSTFFANYSSFVPLSPYCATAFRGWTPNHIWITVDLSRQSVMQKFFVVLFSEKFFDPLLFNASEMATNANKICDSLTKLVGNVICNALATS